MPILSKATPGEFARNWTILLLDMGISAVASLVAILLMRWVSEPFLEFQHFTLVWIIVSILASFVGFYMFKTYRIVIRYSNFSAVEKLTWATIVKETLLGICLILGLIGSKMLRVDVTTLVLDAMITVFLLLIVRVIMIQAINNMANSVDNNLGRLRVMVYGINNKSISVLTRLQESSHYDVIGILSDNPSNSGQIIQDKRVFVTKSKEDLDELRRRLGFECVLFSSSTESNEELDHEFVNRCLDLGIHVLNTPRIENIKFGNMTQEAVKEISRDVEYIADGMTSIGRNLKRAVDCVASAACLVVFSPLFLIVYIAIKMEDHGPAIYKQERIGRFGRPFFIYKFRSMRTDAEAMGPALYSGEDDPRLTKVGRFIRAHHLDELPQLFNVFKGDMAFIGWRPERQFYIDQIMEADPRYYYLYQIRPGVTSYATLYNGYTDTLEKMLKRLEYDLYYLRHRSWAFDIKILFMTFMSIVFGKKF